MNLDPKNREYTIVCQERKRAAPCSSDENTFKRLRSREILGRNRFEMTDAISRELFQSMKMNVSLDLFESANMTQKLAFSDQRCRITSICMAQDVICALTLSGICSAYSRDSSKKLCELNIHDDEVIRSIFYNKIDDSVIIISVKKATRFGVLSCRSVQIRNILKGIPKEGLPLFDGETLEWPGYIEFDDLNDKIITKSASERFYKVWDMKNYDLSYTINIRDIHEVKSSVGYLLVVCRRKSGHIKFVLLNADTGEALKSFQQMTHRQKMIEFVEFMGRFVFIKNYQENVQIINVDTLEISSMDNTEAFFPNSFVYFHKQNMFATFQKGRMKIWNLRDGHLPRDKHGMLWSQDRVNSMCTDAKQEFIIYSTAGSCAEDKTIRIVKTRTGEEVAQILPGIDTLDSSTLSAFGLTVLLFDDVRKEIHGGFADGCVRTWIP